MSGYQSFAVVGAGVIGKYIVDALIEKKDAGVISSVAVLSRSANTHKDLASKGAKVVAVDYNSAFSIQSALSGVDVVISTIGNDNLEVQDNLVLAAKAAGVKLFVPSEFGFPSDEPSADIWGAKYEKKQRLKNELHLPYTAFYTGLYPDFVFARGFSETMGFDFVKGEFKIPGTGSVAISWTHRVDIGRYLAHTLTALPKDRIEWRTFRMEGERTNYNQIVDDWKKRSGKDVAISHLPRSHFEDSLAKDPSNHVNELILKQDKGKGVVGKSDEITNYEFPDWNPRKVVDALVELYGQ
ncbi:hypothetical protein ACEPAH_3569 [Sanghuangporus vaninii]